MKIIIKAKNIELTPYLEKFVEEKIGSLQKFISILRQEGNIGKSLAEAFVEIEKTTKHHRSGDIFRAEARIELPGRTIMAEALRDDLLKAIVEVKDEMQREIKKYKLKKIDKSRRPQRKPKGEI